MKDYIVIEVMLSVGHSNRKFIEKFLNKLVTLPITDEEGVYKKGPFLWIQFCGNQFVQFLVFSKAGTVKDAVQETLESLEALTRSDPSIIIEQIMPTESMEITYYTEDEGETTNEGS